MMINLQQIVDMAKLAALEAGRAIMRIYARSDFEIEVKDDQSPLTLADKNAHAIIVGKLEETGFPILSEEGAAIDYATRKKWEYFWLIDPLDGTKEFISKNGEFTVNIAFVHFDKPVAGVVYAPAIDTLYLGAKGLGVQKNVAGYSSSITPVARKTSLNELMKKKHLKIAVSRSHPSPDTGKFISRFTGPRLITKGSSLKFMLLLEDEADLYPRFGSTMEWDTAAAHAILNVVNRGVYTIDSQKELAYNKPQLINPYFIAF